MSNDMKFKRIIIFPIFFIHKEHRELYTYKRTTIKKTFKRSHRFCRYILFEQCMNELIDYSYQPGSGIRFKEALKDFNNIIINNNNK